MTDQAPEVPTDPAGHFTETLESCVDRGRRIALRTDGTAWVGGVPVHVGSGVVVLDDDNTRRRWHLRVADIQVIREYQDGGPGGPPA